ncbi:hypothetical protein BST43_06570 [Mycobacteroides saopaulense]|uniref:DUF732 domain-containing protein n=1 Tax=Mycobacteroides saopaulense TaxID=1578165 RepID=A0A1X0JAS7_9MYCO|nr:hypothetical protein [Mycobacteroides saopaulense]ORB59656.1 hypothetical protein BST43_06570 [Mycobacteroides saopaulense]
MNKTRTSKTLANISKKSGAALVAAPALVAGLIAAPSAHASTLWAAVAWKSDKTVQRFYNYPEMTQMVFDIQGWSKDAGYQPFSSGNCGAVATYTDPLEYTRFSYATGKTRDEASRKALAPLDAYLLDSFCQD